MRFSVVAPAAVVALVAAAASGAAAGGAPVPVTIVLEGVAAGQGIRGTFTASGPLCAEGTFVDGTAAPRGEKIRVKRVLTCGGRGDVVFVYDGVTENRDGEGTWKIFSATGEFAALRGKGSARNVATSYDPAKGTGTFRNTWSGIAAFDAVAPSPRRPRSGDFPPHPRRVAPAPTYSGSPSPRGTMSLRTASTTPRASPRRVASSPPGAEPSPQAVSR